MTRTHEEIEQIVNDLGYDLLAEYSNNYSQRRVIIKDKIGYKYDIDLSHLINKRLPYFVGIDNPFSLENIVLWLSINKPEFELCKNNIYKWNGGKLIFYHTVCEEYFEMSWQHIWGGNGCGVCAGQQVGKYNNLAYLRPDLREEWDYDKNFPLTPNLVTRGTPRKVFWICNVCGRGWRATISSRCNGRGCPACKMSGGEKRISYWLNENNISYIFQYSNHDLKSNNNRKLEYDFALLDNKNNIRCFIEFDDIQHINFIPFFHKTQEGFKNHKNRDKLKNKYAKQNDIPLLRINVKDYNNIESILTETLL